MDKIAKEEREQAKRWLRDACRECAPDGSSTLLVVRAGSGPSITGRDDRFSVEVLGIVSGRPIVLENLNLGLSMAMGYRLAEDDTIVVPGLSYGKGLHIARELSQLCGHPVQVEGSYRGVVK